METEKKTKKATRSKKASVAESSANNSTSTTSKTSTRKKSTSKKSTTTKTTKKTTGSTKTSKSTPRKTSASQKQPIKQEKINTKKIVEEQKLDEPLNNDVLQESEGAEEHSKSVTPPPHNENQSHDDNQEIQMTELENTNVSNSDVLEPTQSTEELEPPKDEKEKDSITENKDRDVESKSQIEQEAMSGIKTDNSMQTFIDIDRVVLDSNTKDSSDGRQSKRKSTKDKKPFGKIKSLLKKKDAKKDNKKDSYPVKVNPNVPSAEDIEKGILEQYGVENISDTEVDYIHDKEVALPDQLKLQEEFFNYDFTKLEKSETLTLSVDNLYKRFGRKQAVNGVSFGIHTGEVVGFLGPNGAGKTTVFYMIVGFLTPDHGSILFNSVSMEKLPMYKHARLGISYLPQEPSVFRRLSVEKNIIAVLQTIKGITDDERRKRLENLIDEFGLGAYRKQRAYTLSGGERRRTEIARGMALHPYFLLLDEPFTGIDPKARYELKQIIKALSRKGVGVLITDHNERDTLSITDRAFILHNGDIVAQGSREEIMNNVKAREIYLGEEYS